jgi:uncharacterized membrane protein
MLPSASPPRPGTFHLHNYRPTEQYPDYNKRSQEQHALKCFLTAMEGGGNISGDEIIEMAVVVAAVAGLKLGGQEAAESMAKAAVKEALIGDFGLSEELIRQRGKELPPNSSAFIVLFEHRWAKKLKDIAIREYGGTVVDQRIINDEVMAMLGSKLQEASKAGDV